MQVLSFSLTSCEKQLGVKPDKQQVTPNKLSDLQAMLDYTPKMVVTPTSAENSADDYFLPDATLNLFPKENRDLYTYQKENIFSGPGSDWGGAYAKVYYCNIALETLNKIGQTTENLTLWNSIKGQALFKRSKEFWHIADIWTLPYDSSTAIADLGIPLRLNSNFEEHSKRSSLQQTYNQIINDLKSCVNLLPVSQVHPERPIKAAAYAMLSRVFLSMRNYTQAKLYTDSALALNNTLMDYNMLNANLNYTMSPNNVEVVFFSLSGDQMLGAAYAKIDTTLYNMYDTNDLRKKLFFRSRPNNFFSFKGSYANSDGLFSGLAVDELYLTKAECLARSGNVADAMKYLNNLLIKRYKTGNFVPVTATTSADGLMKILNERRKELLMRFVRWSDVRRLNKEGAGIILRRFVNGQAYTLMPNSRRYALPLPEDIIAISGMQQNTY